MDYKRTRLTALITATIATGCSASKIDSQQTLNQDYCRNGGETSDYSCNPEQQNTVPQSSGNINNPNTEAWMNSKLSDIKSWLKTIKENPSAATATPYSSDAALKVRNPAATNPRLIEIEKLSAKGEHRKAMAAINSFIADNPDNLEADLTKGLVLTNMGQESEAEALLRNAIGRHPTSPELYNNLAVIYSNKGDYGQAIETLLLAFSTHPSYAQVNENLRKVYSSVASLAYNRALDLDSDKKLTPELVVLRRISAPGLPVATTNSLGSSFSLANTQKQAPVKTTILASASNSADAVKKPAPKITLPPVVKVEKKVISTAKPEVKVAAPKPIEVAARTQVELPIPKLEDPAPEKKISTLSIKQPVAKQTKTVSIVRVDKPKVDKASPKSTIQLAVKAVNRWSWTWTSQNVNAYLGSYVPGYKPNKKTTNAEWRSIRTKRLTKPSFIKVKLTKMKSKQINKTTVEVTFLQHYQANTYKDKTNKRLIMKKVNNRWLISRETNI